MPRSGRHPLIAGALTNSAGTLASRVLGMLRDMATASLLGLAGGGAMDALVVAYRVPNLFRALFGEGALTACYLPVFTALDEHEPHRAWQLTSVLLVWLAVGLGLLAGVGEVIYALLWWFAGDNPATALLALLGGLLLPYVVLVCLAAVLTATLHARGYFALPALAPAALNLCWLAAVGVAAWQTHDRAAQAVIIAGGILLGGWVQIAMQWPLLRRLGFRFDYAPAAVAEPMRRMAAAAGPMLVGLAATQLSTFCDSVVAWSLAAAPGGDTTLPLLGLRYPLQQGAAAAVYFGERMYQFPLGLLGIAVATAIFPLLSRHAARGEHARIGDDLGLGLRLVLALSVPAGVGLMMIARPLTIVLFEHGRFSAHDSARAAQMIACYAAGIWAYCALPVVIRGFYALGDTRTPARIAIWMVGFNLALDLTLIWPLAEAGLAVGTALSASTQVILLAVAFSRGKGSLTWKPLAATALRAALAAAAMAAAMACANAWLTRSGIGAIDLGHASPLRGDGRFTASLVQFALLLPLGAVVYVVAHRLLGGRELSLLLRRERDGH